MKSECMLRRGTWSMGLFLLANASLRDGGHTVGSCLGVNGLGGENLQFLSCEAHDVCRKGEEWRGSWSWS
jgi:hypothetical protein